MVSINNQRENSDPLLIKQKETNFNIVDNSLVWMERTVGFFSPTIVIREGNGLSLIASMG